MHITSYFTQQQKTNITYCVEENRLKWKQRNGHNKQVNKLI
jgi:hypothetical protein